jgi:hypothetical protein
MKEVASIVRRHLEGVVGWAQSRQTDGCLETIKTVIYLISGKLNFRAVNPHASQTT